MKTLPKEKVISNKITNEIRTDYRICCLSKTYKNILMWSHYADSHKGICIGFKINDEKNFKLEINGNNRKIDKVKYVKDFSELRAIKFFRYTDSSEKDLIKKYLSYKYRIWKYEKEYRIILPSEKIKNHKGQLKYNSIKQIIFGSEVTPKVIKLTIQEIKNNNSCFNNIEFYQLQNTIGKYKMERVKIFPDNL